MKEMENKNQLKQRLLAETNGFCIYCGHKVNEQTMEIEHIIPKAKGGEDSYGNYVCACHKCNADKADKMPQVFLAEMRQKKQKAFRNRLAGLQKGQRLSAEKARLLIEGRPEEIMERLSSELFDVQGEIVPHKSDAENADNCFIVEIGRIAGRPIVLRLSFTVELDEEERAEIPSRSSRTPSFAPMHVSSDDDELGFW